MVIARKKILLRFNSEELQKRVYEAAAQREISVNQYINEILKRSVKPLRGERHDG